jgi:hypothetical protein
MGLIRKVASIMMLGGVSSHTRREPPGKAERARAKAERDREKAAQAQAVRPEAEAKVAEEQAAALAKALREDEAHRQADLREVAEKEAEAVPEWPPDPCASSGTSASAASCLAASHQAWPSLAGDQQEPPRRDEVLDRVSARVVTGPGPYALLTTGALMGADERARHRRSLRQALVSQQRRGTDLP